MIKIAIPIYNENKVCDFSQCKKFVVYSIEPFVHKEYNQFAKNDYDTEIDLKNFIKQIKRLDVSVVIAYSIPEFLLLDFAINKIDLYLGIRDTDYEHIIKLYMHGLLRSKIE